MWCHSVWTDSVQGCTLYHMRNGCKSLEVAGNCWHQRRQFGCSFVCFQCGRLEKNRCKRVEYILSWFTSKTDSQPWKSPMDLACKGTFRLCNRCRLHTQPCASHYASCQFHPTHLCTWDNLSLNYKTDILSPPQLLQSLLFIHSKISYENVLLPVCLGSWDANVNVGSSTAMVTDQW